MTKERENEGPTNAPRSDPFMGARNWRSVSGHSPYYEDRPIGGQSQMREPNLPSLRTRSITLPKLVANILVDEEKP